jgi:RHS repeat-associated protein
MGQSVTFSNYNGFGKPQTKVDANGITTLYSYDNGGRLTAETTAGLTTSLTYDDAGNLTRITLPGGKQINYSYTDANLLQKISDNFVNSITYSHDTEGNITRQEFRGSGNSLKKYVNYQFDDHNRLAQISYPGNVAVLYNYDDNGNLVHTVDETILATDFTYDSLNRQKTMTRPGRTVTRYTYNEHDELTDFTDPENNTTSYTRDDLGRIVSTVSADSGTTTAVYDAADNATSITDANSYTTLYQYDALNRMTSIGFVDASENISYGYDSGSNGIGRLTSMSDPAGSTTYNYNAFGLLSRENRITNGITFTTQYSYNNNHDLSAMTYPSGLQVSWNRDSAGQITGTEINGQEVSSQVTSLPYGPVTTMTLGSININRNYDQRYLLTENNAGAVFSHTYTRDDTGRVTAIDGVADFTDAVGLSSYSYQANRLTGSTGVDAAQYSYDNNGNITSDGTRTFTYNQSNQLVRVNLGSTVLAEYGYDGSNRRVSKTVNSVTTLYLYDNQGNLIAETAEDGTPERDIIYQNGERIAMQLYGDKAGLYYFLNDHLGAPRALVDSAGTIVWRAAYLPFGKAQLITETITNNFRFPGQYFDEETGLHYNMHRYYNPATGRYMTPDPIGLEGGINLYGFVQNDPVNFVDPWGLRGSYPYYPTGADVKAAVAGATFGVKAAGITAYEGTKYAMQDVLVSSAWVLASYGTGSIAGLSFLGDQIYAKAWDLPIAMYNGSEGHELALDIDKMIRSLIDSPCHDNE